MLSTSRIFAVSTSNDQVARITGAAFIVSELMRKRIPGKQPNAQQIRTFIEYLTRADWAKQVREHDAGEIVIQLLLDMLQDCPTNLLIKSRQVTLFVELQHPGSLEYLLEQVSNKNVSVFVRIEVLSGLLRLARNKNQRLSLDQDKRLKLALQKLMDDPTEFGTFCLPSESQISGSQPQQEDLITVQIGDIALATAILLEDRKLTEFGFPKAASTSTTPDVISIAPQFAGFPDFDQRRQAFEQWKRRENKPTPTDTPKKPH